MNDKFRKKKSPIASLIGELPQPKKWGVRERCLPAMTLSIPEALQHVQVTDNG